MNVYLNVTRFKAIISVVFLVSTITFVSCVPQTQSPTYSGEIEQIYLFINNVDEEEKDVIVSALVSNANFFSRFTMLSNEIRIVNTADQQPDISSQGGAPFDGAQAVVVPEQQFQSPASEDIEGLDDLSRALEQLTNLKRTIIIDVIVTSEIIEGSVLVATAQVVFIYANLEIAQSSGTKGVVQRRQVVVREREDISQLERELRFAVLYEATQGSVEKFFARELIQE